MFKLIRKDLLMHKMDFPLYVPIFVGVLVLQAWRGFSPSFFVILACIYGTIFPAILTVLEDKSRAGAFNCSLSVTRVQIVRAKYVISWAIALAVTLVGLVFYSLIAAESLWEIWTMSTVGQALVILSLGLGMTLPVSLRYGFWGFVGGFLGMQILAIVALLVVRVLFPDLQLVNTFIALSDFIAGTRAQLGAPLFLMTILVASVVFNLVSCQIAVMLFKRKEF
ncbi:MAG TPA: ABC-2 transporter permease [Pirellulaceae bacterium]|jgi:hypothetical protein|nr:ABC-2 transporter permease [Pirellulaceae bacterium]